MLFVLPKSEVMVRLESYHFGVSSLRDFHFVSIPPYLFPVSYRPSLSYLASKMTIEFSTRVVRSPVSSFIDLVSLLDGRLRKPHDERRNKRARGGCNTRLPEHSGASYSTSLFQGWQGLRNTLLPYPTIHSRTHTRHRMCGRPHSESGQL